MTDDIQRLPGQFPPNLIFRAKDAGRLVISHDGRERPLRDNALLVPDYGRREVGLLRWKPFDDSEMRMALHGEQPPDDEEDDYLPCLRWPVLVQGFGLARMTVTSRGFISAAKRWFGNFIAAPEAIGGQLCVYRVEPSAGYEPKKAALAGTLYAPVWRPAGWVQRDASVFGKRLVAAPLSLPAADTLPAIATDALFDSMTTAGELLLPEPKPKARAWPAKPAPRGGAAGLLPADDLDDAIPF